MKWLIICFFEGLGILRLKLHIQTAEYLHHLVKLGKMHGSFHAF